MCVCVCVCVGKLQGNDEEVFVEEDEGGEVRRAAYGSVEGALKR